MKSLAFNETYTWVRDRESSRLQSTRSKVQLTPDKAHNRVSWNQQSKCAEKLASKPILKKTSWIYMHGVLNWALGHCGIRITEERGSNKTTICNQTLSLISQNQPYLSLDQVISATTNVSTSLKQPRCWQLQTHCKTKQAEENKNHWNHRIEQIHKD
jgi:type IV secretory pathway ATPase VirB11/archaellum biosynthesis ATPase